MLSLGVANNPVYAIAGAQVIVRRALGMLLSLFLWIMAAVSRHGRLYSGLAPFAAWLMIGACELNSGLNSGLSI
jgi:hypothetical protein